MENHLGKYLEGETRYNKEAVQTQLKIISSLNLENNSLNEIFFHTENPVQFANALKCK